MPDRCPLSIFERKTKEQHTKRKQWLRNNYFQITNKKDCAFEKGCIFLYNRRKNMILNLKVQLCFCVGIFWASKYEPSLLDNKRHQYY